MGVDHVGERGDRSPEFGVGDANANCPPPLRFCHIGTKRASCGLQNTLKSVFGRGSAPDPAGRVDDAPQNSRLRKGHPSPYPIPRGTNPCTFGARHASPQTPSQIYAYGYLYGVAKLILA